ncbi:hypothetical protein ACSSS7_003030 [Eimeria intestinalis]
MANEPSVLLGYLGESVPSDDQTGAEALSKFGGEPLKCLPCHDSALCYTVSHFARRATPYCLNKRCLYLFGCHRRPDCSKFARNWRAVRGVFGAQADDSPLVATANIEGEAACTDKTQEAEAAADSSDWLEAAFGARMEGEGAPSADEHRGKRQPAAHTPARPTGAGRAVSADELMPPSFLQVEAEPPDNSRDDATGGLEHLHQLLSGFLLQAAVPASFSLNTSSGVALGSRRACRNGSLDQEAYEESPDKVFLKLQKRLSRSPTQVVRYSFGGKPLFIYPLSEEAARSIGECPLCRKERVFEMQLVPMAADEISKRCVAIHHFCKLTSGMVEGTLTTFLVIF